MAPSNGKQTYEVAEIGCWYVGGRTATLRGLAPVGPTYSSGVSSGNQNGDVSVESMYVQYVRLANPRGKVPLMLWHGGGLTGTTYETKPDGKPGWQNYFLTQGWDVYVSDAVERGRSGFAVRQIWDSEPIVRTNQRGWESFRIGAGTYTSDASKRQSLPNGQFPIESFDEFAKYTVPRWTINDAAIQKAYDELVAKGGPAVILSHSQGAQFMYQSALNAPGKVSALINDEGRPLPNMTDAQVAAIKGIPHLFLCGDIDPKDEHWVSMRESARKLHDRLLAAGGSSDFYDLAQMGIRGNSHMNMMDRNSDEVGALIQKWLASKGLVR